MNRGHLAQLASSFALAVLLTALLVIAVMLRACLHAFESNSQHDANLKVRNFQSRSHRTAIFNEWTRHSCSVHRDSLHMHPTGMLVFVLPMQRASKWVHPRNRVGRRRERLQVTCPASIMYIICISRSELTWYAVLPVRHSLTGQAFGCEFSVFRLPVHLWRCVPIDLIALNAFMCSVQPYR